MMTQPRVLFLLLNSILCLFPYYATTDAFAFVSVSRPRVATTNQKEGHRRLSTTTTKKKKQYPFHQRHYALIYMPDGSVIPDDDADDPYHDETSSSSSTTILDYLNEPARQGPLAVLAAAQANIEITSIEHIRVVKVTPSTMELEALCSREDQLCVNVLVSIDFPMKCTTVDKIIENLGTLYQQATAVLETQKIQQKSKEAQEQQEAFDRLFSKQLQPPPPKPKKKDEVIMPTKELVGAANQTKAIPEGDDEISVATEAVDDAKSLLAVTDEKKEAKEDIQETDDKKEFVSVNKTEPVPEEEDKGPTLTAAAAAAAVDDETTKPLVAEEEEATRDDLTEPKPPKKEVVSVPTKTDVKETLAAVDKDKVEKSSKEEDVDQQEKKKSPTVVVAIVDDSDTIKPWEDPSLSLEEKAFAILLDLGMIQITPNPSDPDYDHSKDDELCEENTWKD